MKSHPSVLEQKMPTRQVYVPNERVLAYRRAERMYDGEKPRDVLEVGVVQQRYSGVLNCDTNEWATPQQRRGVMDAGGCYLVKFGMGRAAVICLNHWTEMMPVDVEMPAGDEE